ncbi:hypothetical protein HN51_052271 [Arachis hypogaea]|uniref:LNS2/PITP domain-containing protein n=1 Tax=Arachis hypogaea TaxID=3818 RepID=A0A445CBB1_ARAHY|nr:phosphatidate phosphatase PAH1 isoform X1 [Arachis ipaensis]XP_025668000.1 phosphatidate phosphatase PAH1 isoform X1 [Arachis hypogaea]QHN93591.1 Phosphatidate phosphatase [Arachis hypogaea]RYR48232.1 hypothetical protein Ahy_A07g034237 isoform A [Arachis hypogaea]
MRRIGSYITQGVYTVSGPFHPFGGAVDIVVVEQPDGTFKSSPWYVRFGKFQGVLKAREKIVDINVNGIDADFHMHLDHKGEAYFLREVDAEYGDAVIYPSSGDEYDDNRSRHLNDMQIQERLRSKSCNYDSENSNGNAGTRSRGSLLGFVFGRKSIEEGEECGDKYGVEQMAPAEIAADLLELKWSTNIKSDRRPPRFVDKRKIAKSSSDGDVLQEALPPLAVKEEEASSFSNSNSEHGHDKTMIKIDVAHEVECDSNGKQGGLAHECADFPVELVEVEAGGGFERKLSDGELAPVSAFASPTGVSSVDDNISADEVAQSVVFFETSEKATVECANESSATSHDVSSTFSPPKDLLGVQATTKSPAAGLVEEENFLFSDLDESKINDQLDRPVSPESVDKEEEEEEEEEHHSCDDGDVKDENLVSENGDLHSSSPMAIPRTEAAGEDIGHTGSLPNITTRSISLGQPEASYPLSQSLDTRSKSLPWLFPENEDSSEANGNQLSNAKSGVGSPPSGWRLWPFSRSVSQTYVPPMPSDTKDTTFEQSSENTISTDPNKNELKTDPKKKHVRVKVPTSEQIASLHLKEGGNTVMFTFSTAMLGRQQVDCRIYLWKWNTRIVISDVDGTITKSDVLGQFMPLVGIDWSQTGVAHLFSAIKENGYQLLFLSARSISQAYLTRQFLFNLKQDGKALPDGPVVISPDGLFPSLYREVIRRVPHEFKIACLEDIKSLFPSDCNPFYAGFGNRDTDEISYLKVGIPIGKIFIINPRGEIVVNRRIDTKSYTSLHALVNGMFPPMISSSEQEDFNSWNFWKLPPPVLDL